MRIPTSALRLLLEVPDRDRARGNAVSIIPIHAELTTQEAADVLNVSRPFLVQLLEKGDMPFHKIGTHRRVRYQDVIAYKKRIDAERRKAWMNWPRRPRNSAWDTERMSSHFTVVYDACVLYPAPLRDG